MKISETTRRQAIKALDGMAEIVKAEMLRKEMYIDDIVRYPERVNAICGGRKACAIGSLWLGGGIKPIIRGSRTR